MYSITGYELTAAVLFVARFIDCCLQLCVYLQTTPGSVVQAAPCHPSDLDPTHQNQNFSAPALSLETASPLLSLLSGLAVDAGPVFTIGSPLTLNDASASSNVFLNATSPPVGPNGSTGLLVHVASGLCFDATQGLNFPPPIPVSLMPCGANREAFQTLSSSTFLGALAVVEPSVWGPQVGERCCCAALMLQLAPFPPPFARSVSRHHLSHQARSLRRPASRTCPARSASPSPAVSCCLGAAACQRR
jgi:hypothetical protein